MNWETSKRPLVIAHRGFTHGHPENSLEAIQAAIDLGADGVEVDLRLTRDGEIVIYHDREPEEMTRQEVHCLPGPVPTLTELLELVRGRCLLNLEVKNTKLFSAIMEKKVLELLKNYPRETILFSSFHPPTLWRLRRIAPSYLRGQLFTPRQRFIAPFATPWIQPFSMNIPLASLNRPRVSQARAAGRRVFVWTVNDEDAIKKCLDLRIDGIITDEPQRLLQLLRTDRA